MSHDDPQTTPHPDGESRNSILAILVRQTHLLREDVANIGSKLDGLSGTMMHVVNEVSRLSSEVERLNEAHRNMSDELGGVRSRLRAVHGGD